MTPPTSPPGGVVATPPGGELHPDHGAGTSTSATPIWDELADRWAELVAGGALDALVLPLDVDEPAGGAPCA